MCVKLSDTRRSAVPDMSSTLSAGEALPAAPWTLSRRIDTLEKVHPLE